MRAGQVFCRIKEARKAAPGSGKSYSAQKICVDRLVAIFLPRNFLSAGRPPGCRLTAPMRGGLGAVLSRLLAAPGRKA